MSILLDRRRSRPGINIVPLMDVLTIMIFFFLVSMQFKELTALNLTLPKIETAGRNEIPETVQIAIDQEGAIFLDGNEVPLEGLRSLLGQLSDVETDIPVLIKAHNETPLQKVTDVMDACRVNGLNKIRLQSR